MSKLRKKKSISTLASSGEAEKKTEHTADSTSFYGFESVSEENISNVKKNMWNMLSIKLFVLSNEWTQQTFRNN